MEKFSNCFEFKLVNFNCEANAYQYAFFVVNLYQLALCNK